MNSLLRPRVRCVHRIQVLLLLAVISLAAQFSCESLVQSWRLLRPGSIGIDYLPDSLFQLHRSSCLARGYAGYLPRHYTSMRTWPLVVHLHGSGESGNNPSLLVHKNRYPSSVMSAMSSTERNVIVLVPQCWPERYWKPSDVLAFEQRINQ
jgi:hypothetical protein